MRVRRGVTLVVAVLACTGCVASDPAPADLTPAGIGDVVSDHVEATPVDVAGWNVMTRELGVDAPGATLEFPEGESLAVAVAPTTDSSFVCATPDFFDECVRFDHDGVELLLGWQEQVPEEDPGVVYVVQRRDDEDVLVQYIGASITGDPRDLDLGISLDEMADIVTDERLTLG